MVTKTDNLIIEQYYNTLQIYYTLFYSKGTDGLHYGFWEEGTKNTRESIINPIKFVCRCLEIDNGDVILDAGCGVGGTSIYMAKNYGAKITGITISDMQLKIAKKKALKLGLQDRVKFFKQDYTQTNFKDSTFTKIFGIESICYAHKKIDFLNEAIRLLKKDGRIAVVDAFLIRTNLNKKEKEIYEKFLNGWAVPNLSTKDDFHNDLKKVGFKNIKFYDKLEVIKKSSSRIYRLGIIGYPFTLFLSRMRIIPKNMHGHALACINQKKLVDNNIVTYGVFVAEK